MADQHLHHSDARAWLGYKDGELVAIELSGFHAGETVAGWEARGYRVEQVSNAEAMRRWREEVQEAATPRRSRSCALCSDAGAETCLCGGVR